MKIDLNKFYELVNQKYLSVQKHETEDLLIWNYTQKAQFERFWTPETLMARGLITDLEGNIKARPFKKFFNYDEHMGEDSKLPKLPVEEFDVYDKLDGSLGILYHLKDGTPQIATRGSFTSDQAIKATKMLHQRLLGSPGFTVFDPDWTWLFEIIYPENRIVVDYGKIEDLFLLACIRTDNGDETPISIIKDFPFPKVNMFDGVTDLTKIKEIGGNNREGFVVRFRSGIRTKIKYDEYIRLHRLVTGVNAKTIWELLRNEQPFDELLDRVPDEFYSWVNETKKLLEARFLEISKEIQAEMFKITTEMETIFGDGTGSISRDKINGNPELRKHFASLAVKAKYPGLLFAMIDNKNYKDLIWKIIKPRADKPFKEDES